jgi:hypothetical protein
VGAILRFLTCTSSFSLSLAAPTSLFPKTLPLTELVALCPPAMGVCGGVGCGKPTEPAELVAVTIGTWLSVGVGLFVTAGVCTEDIVAIEDCELDRAGLPGLKGKNGAAGDTSDGPMAGDAFAKDGEATLIGVGVGVVLIDPAANVGWLIVGCGPV